MKRIVLSTLLLATIVARAGNQFSLLEINPLQGKESFLWSDSSKHVYGAGELSGFTELNGKLYFSAQSSFNNYELWCTDGTAEGTKQVAEINPNGSAAIGHIVEAGGRLYFMATENGMDWDLFTSNGTSAGTTKVADLNQSWNNALAPNTIAVHNGRLIFCTPDSVMAVEGASATLKSLRNIPAYNTGFGYCELNNMVHFLLHNSNGEIELWKTDGTPAGTQSIRNLFQSGGLNYVSQMVAFNGKFYVGASVSGQGMDVYTITADGDVQKVNIAQGGNSYPGEFTLYNNALYFTASDINSANVFRITTTNPVPQPLVQGAAFSMVSSTTFANNRVYFIADDAENVRIVNLQNLQYNSVSLADYTIPQYWGSPVPNGFLTGTGGRVFLALYEKATGKQILAETDADFSTLQTTMPSGANTDHPFNVIVACGMADVFDLRMWNNQLLVPANFNDAGRELWIMKTDIVNSVDETLSTTSVQLYPNPASNFVTIQTTLKDATLAVFDQQGRIVHSTLLNSEGTIVALEELAAGNYCAVVADKRGNKEVKKFAVTR